MHNILVTGVGGNVGQGVLKNLRNFDSSFTIIGANISAVSAGNYLCNKVYKVPYAYEDGYIEKIKEIITQERIDLIIPTTDFECLYLSKSDIKNVVTSPYYTNQIFVDKYQTYLKFKEFGIPFATSFLPSECEKNSKKDYIFKPRMGRGSRGILINPKSIGDLKDEDYMGQDYIEGREITTAFYVTKDGNIHGAISMYRELVNGMTDSCSVTFDYEDQIDFILKRITNTLTVFGSCNVQSRVNQDGKIIPFEVNGRISGTNSIRSHFGFNDVQYIVEEYLLNKAPSPVKIMQGSALRIVTDIIYPGISEVKEISTTIHKPILF